ncbi:hypothetical protein G9A89_004967 [Geosiphon pyriformis]|nr:hypothetical protein G9A89_004967 [Geosiphon pyriformis]
MAPSMVVDCVQEIIKYLENDINSLYSCLLVDRFWCANVVGFLWKRPFHFLEQPSRALIRTYVSCLSKEQHKLFEEAGVELPLKRPIPTFNYAVFLRELVLTPLYKSVSDWLLNVVDELGDHDVKRWKLYKGSAANFVDSKSQRRLVVKELCKLFFLRCPTFDLLDVTEKRIALDIPDEDFLLYNYPGARVCLANLHELNYTGYRNIDFFTSMSQICREIRRLHIWSLGSFCAQNLALLIRMQNRLENLTLVDCDHGMKAVFSELKKHKKTLNLLELHKVNCSGITLDAVSTFEKLVSLKISSCGEASGFLMNPRNLENHSMNLKEFYCIGTCIPTESICNIIQLANQKLLKLTIDQLVKNQGSSNIYLTVAQYCPQIAYIDLAWQDHEQRQLITLLNSCRLLTYLRIRTNYYAGRVNATGFLPQLGEALPRSLRDLHLDWDFSVEAMHEFFQNCKAPLKTLVFHQNCRISNDHLKVIIGYAVEKQTLKILRMECCDASRELLKKAARVIDVVTSFTR